MRLLRMSLLAAVVAGAAATGLLVPTDAQASVSIAVGFDALVKDAESVGVVMPVESKSVWEEGRIITYTRVKVEQGVAGELGTGGEGWVRTMGGVVGKIGQLVDGEPVFNTNKPSLIFMRKFKQGGTWEVAARAQGQFPVIVEEVAAKKVRKVTRSGAVGMLFPPKAPETASPAAAGPVKAVDSPTAVNDGAKLRLAGEVLHDRTLDDATREIASAWKRLHSAPAASDAKK